MREVVVVVQLCGNCFEHFIVAVGIDYSTPSLSGRRVAPNPTQSNTLLKLFSFRTSEFKE